MNGSRCDIAVRIAMADDASRAVAVSEAAFAPLRNVYRPTREAIARQKERDNEGTQLVAEIDGCIVGTVEFDVHEHHLYLIGLAVDPDYQRRSMARMMVEWVVQHAATLGRNTVSSNTIRETGNVPIFESLGFCVVSETTAQWCESDVHAVLHDVKLERSVT